MKNLAITILFSSFLFSCQESEPVEDKSTDTNAHTELSETDEIPEEPKEKIEHEFTALADDNPSKEHFESLLNSYYEDFEELPFGEVDFKSSELVYGYTLFKSVDSKTNVQFFFADHQDDLITFGKANFEEGYYGVNGGGLFLVSGEDEQAMNDILSWFSGKE